MTDPRKDDDDEVTATEVAAMKRQAKLNGDGWPQDHEESNEHDDE